MVHEAGKKIFQKKLSAQIRLMRELSESSLSEPPSRRPSGVALLRALAFLFDLTLIAFAGRLISWPLGELPQAVGEEAWWIGLAAAWIYFGIGDSRLSHGMSPGKRILGIEVQRLDAVHLSIADSFLRFFPFALAFAAFCAQHHMDPALPLSLILRLIAAVSLAAILAFGLFHPYRRSVQDLLAGSMVIKRGAPFRMGPAGLKRPLAASVATGLFASAAIIVHGLIMANDGLGDLRRELKSRAGVEHVEVRRSLAPWKGDEAVESIIITAHIPPSCAECEAPAAAIGLFDAAVSNELEISGARQVVVTVRRGYDMGLWAKMSYSTSRFAVTSETISKVRYRTTFGKSQEEEKKPRPEGGEKPKR